LSEKFDKTIVFYPPVEWGGLFQRPQYLATGLARWFKRVIYIQPAGLRNPRLKDLRRLKGFASPSSNHGRKIPANLEIKHLPFLPLHGFGPFEGWNARVLNGFLKGLGGCGEGQTIFWMASPAPFLARTIAFRGQIPLIFDWLDDYAIFQQLPLKVVEMQWRALEEADLVFASSKELLKRAQGRGAKRAFFLPNGVDPEPWLRAAREISPAPEKDVSATVGYFGTISHWMDKDLVLKIARALPTWRFVFIGPRADKGALDEVFQLENCRHVEAVCHDRLPELAARFDVCWIPFMDNSQTRAINPVKVYEYLALGKPVVAPELPDLAELSHVLYLAKSQSEWKRQLELALRQKGVQELVTARQEAAKDYSWKLIVERAVRILAENKIAGALN